MDGTDEGGVAAEDERGELEVDDGFEGGGSAGDAAEAGVAAAGEAVVGGDEDLDRAGARQGLEGVADRARVRRALVDFRLNGRDFHRLSSSDGDGIHEGHEGARREGQRL